MKIRILTFFLTVFLFSCENEDIAPAKNPTSEVVSIETARSVAIKLAQKKFDSSKPLTDQAANIKVNIKNVDVVARGKMPYFYIFNFDKGFAIISAEKYEHPILAFSDKGEFSRADAPYGITLWIETTKENIDKIRQGIFDTREVTFSEWALAQKSAIPSSAKLAPPPDECEETSTSTQVGPLVATTWNQGCGYNALCPVATGGPCGRAWTGCVATAMTQVMRYWQRPTTYAWATMPNNGANNEVARLMHDAGVSVGMDYGADGSGADDADVPGALIGTFGYASAQHINYGLSSYNTVRNNLNVSRPVVLIGYNKRKTFLGITTGYEEGHAWVCDGYISSTVTWCNEDGSFGGGASYLYFHMNWGWGGTANGFYGFDNWAPTGQGFNFQYARRAVINIAP